MTRGRWQSSARLVRRAAEALQLLELLGRPDRDDKRPRFEERVGPGRVDELATLRLDRQHHDPELLVQARVPDARAGQRAAGGDAELLDPEVFRAGPGRLFQE